MASNLLLGNCGIPLTGFATLNTSADAVYGLNNLFGGNKTDLFRRSAAGAGDTRITLAPAAPSTANFLYVARADLLKASGVGTITLRGHSTTTYASATTVHTISSFGSAALMGPQGDDYLATFATSASYAYWFVNFNSASASRCPCAKVFVGNYFDPGKDPDSEVVITRQRPTGQRKRSLYTLEFSWQGIRYPKAVQMYNTFARNRRHNPAVLFTTSYHGILSGNQVVFGRVLDVTAPPRATDFCDARMVFEELL